MVNQLFYGDNIEVLRKYIKDESVDLCYIDPPFNSKRNYNQIYNNIGTEDRAQAQAFVDLWTWDNFANQGLAEILENYQGRFTAQSIDLIAGLTKVLGKGSLLAYLVSMTLRVAEINRVLKPTGSFYLHCDPTASHYLKLVLDAIFCPNSGEFQNELVWCYSIGGKSKNRFGRKHDVILFYTKSNKDIHTFNQKAASIPRKQNSHMKVGVDTDGREYQEKKDRKTGKIYRYYLDEGKIAEDYWIDVETLNREDRERLGYPTQKPEALLERIIKVSSNEGDVVLDAYCGCGTTVAVCQRLNRQWIGIDITYQSISLILKRLEDTFGKGVLEQIKLNGIPKDIESAIALANKKDDRTRKEFEKWAVLTYSNNRAIINQKKGSDKGIDGIAYFQGDKDEPEKIILQVKSGNVKSGDIRDLQGTMTLEQAAMGIFITLKEPTKEMIKTAKTAGIYQTRYMSQSCDRIQIVTIKEIIEENKRLDIRLSFEVLKSAEKQIEIKATQMKLDI
ncbi:MAG: DNA methyltransferase [Crinalium sp.]